MRTPVHKLMELGRESLASQDGEEFGKLLVEAAKIDPKVVVEIGVHRGYSMDTWRKAFNLDIHVGIENDTRFIAYSDLDVIEGDSGSGEVVELLRSKLRGRFIDVLFLDGDHTYNAVKRDFTLYSPFVKKGGMVVFHDTERRGPQWKGNVEVAQFWDEVVDYYPVESTILFHNQPDSPGTGVLYL